MKRQVLFASALALAAALGAPAQEVFTNGVSVNWYYVYENGMIPVPTNGQTDATVRDLAPSIGQMGGVDPETGAAITNNTDLLTLKPKVLDLTSAANRVFVINADQITNGTALVVSYSGTKLVIGVANGSIGVTQLNTSSVDARYLQKGGDTMTGDLDLNAYDLQGARTLYLDNGELALGRGTNTACRFIGKDAGTGNSGAYVNAMGYEAGMSNQGDSTVFLGREAGKGNTGDGVVAIGPYAARANSGDWSVAMGWQAIATNAGLGVAAVGVHAGGQNAGDYLAALGYCAGFENAGENVNAMGFSAATGNIGDEVNAVGFDAAAVNEGDYVTAIGYSAGAVNRGSNCVLIGNSAGTLNQSDNVIAIGEQLWSLPARSCTLDGDLYLGDCNGKGGGTNLVFASGAAIATTADSFAFGTAALLIQPQSDIPMGCYTNRP